LRVLITGEGGYIGSNLCGYLTACGFECARASARSGPPDPAGFDAVIHCAGIVHAKASRKLYEEVNVVLTENLARKAKEAGVPHFIFVSSIAVYGLDGSGKGQVIAGGTKAAPVTLYGKSKFAAEERIMPMAGAGFAVSVLRLPMVYGKNCPGNYSALRALALTLPVFPLVKNERSMLHMDNLAEFARLLLLCPSEGAAAYFPQNGEPVCVSDLVKAIAEKNGKKIRLSPFLGILAGFAAALPVKAFRSLFGSLVYEKKLSAHFGYAYCVRGFKETVS